MGKITETLEAAQQRAKEQGAGYQGLLTPKEAFTLLESAPGAKLVDVRTRAEIDWVGRIPDAVEIEWMTYPARKPNPYFIAQLEQQVDKEALVLFICRSGPRSHMAAELASQSGYANCINILEGFEGERDNNGHRNTLSGWRASGLPWEQS